MDEYKQAYLRIFNAITDIRNQLEEIRLAAEEIILQEGEDGETNVEQ